MCRTGEVADRTGVHAAVAVDSRGKANRGRGRCDCRMDQHLMAKLAAPVFMESFTQILDRLAHQHLNYHRCSTVVVVPCP